jgi:excisionase family DNA binding protein
MQGISGDRVLLPTTEACKLTGFSREYIQRLLRSKRLEGVKLAHDWLVYQDSLVAFVAQPRKRGRPKRQSTKLAPEPKDTNQDSRSDQS